MAVRIGVDVGGTFTKAVACDTRDRRVVARAVVPTTHGAAHGVAEGVAAALDHVARDVAAAGAGPVELVGHSTTEAVNALLEGDTAVVGVLGIGHRPDLDRARTRTRVRDIRPAPGRRLRTLHELLDATDGLDRATVADALLRLRSQGAEAICVSEAFSVDDPTGERLVLELAADVGLPACAGHELSGLYGLEMRTVTAALNASILPRALRTAGFVESAVARAAPGAALVVMRGDGGAAELSAVRRHPLLTAFSGPAASVVGALHHLSLRDGIVIEVGGTSTNVSAIRGGRPVLAYVRVLDHPTFVRSLDVRVCGVAGGSLVRLGHRLGRWTVADVGPRSAHISGLRYASFVAPEDLAGASVVLESPRAGDLADHAVLHTRSGQRVAPTVTCAANALGLVAPGSHAAGNGESARLGFEAMARFSGRSWDALARSVLEIASRKVADVAHELTGELDLREPAIVGLGGGAGALVPGIARQLRCGWRIPPDAEVISSIGDALAMIRVEVEGSVHRGRPAEVAALHREAEDQAIRAGASPDGLQVESETVAERDALRVIVLGSVAAAGAVPDGWASDESLEAVARAALGDGTQPVGRTSGHAVFRAGAGGEAPFVVLDRRATIATSGRGVVVVGSGAGVASELQVSIPAMVRRLGPVVVAPSVKVLRGERLIDLSLLSAPDQLLEAALTEAAIADREPMIAILSRG